MLPSLKLKSNLFKFQCRLHYSQMFQSGTMCSKHIIEPKHILHAPVCVTSILRFLVQADQEEPVGNLLQVRLVLRVLL